MKINISFKRTVTFEVKVGKDERVHRRRDLLFSFLLFEANKAKW